MTDPTTPRNTESAEELLPPVTPPSAGFIMQLFVIPLLVVSAIVGVWLLLHWLTSQGTSPTELANDIERLNHGSWQKALTLANQLRDPQNDELQRDAALCQQLAQQLETRLKDGGDDTQNIWLRFYLCQALGLFELPDGLPSLAAAATAQQSLADIKVQRAALHAIGSLAARLGPETVYQREDVVEALAAAATSFEQTAENDEATRTGRLEHKRLRSTAAVLLGGHDAPRHHELLHQLVEDPDRDVRYNAAVALAKLGDPKCLDLLIEMANFVPDRPDQMGLSIQELEDWRLFKRSEIVKSAIYATQAFQSRNKDVPLDALVAAVRQALPDVQDEEALQVANSLLGEDS